MNNLLPVVLHGTVIHGKHLARTLKMPTANIVPELDYPGLRLGVYYSSVEINNEKYPAISNLGRTPTISDDCPLTCESYIYNFDSDIYGKEIKVELLKFHRPEIKFESIEELKASMEKDIKQGKLFHKI